MPWTRQSTPLTLKALFFDDGGWWKSIWLVGPWSLLKIIAIHQIKRLRNNETASQFPRHYQYGPTMDDSFTSKEYEESSISTRDNWKDKHPTTHQRALRVRLARKKKTWGKYEISFPFLDGISRLTTTRKKEKRTLVLHVRTGDFHHFFHRLM